MKITWLGHASFKIETSDKLIYIDPYKGEYDSKADLILISHDHYDHFSEQITRQLIKDKTKIFCSVSVASIIHGAESLKPFDQSNYDNIIVKAVPAYNLDKSFHEVGSGIGFIIQTEQRSIYFSGDTDLIPEMKDVKADIVLLPVSGTYVMNAKEAAKAVGIIEPKLAIPMHYGSIVGNIDDAELFKELVEDNTNTEVRILEEGQEIEI